MDEFHHAAASSDRRWLDHLSPQLLVAPFHYFAVADTSDLSVLEWRRGGYVSAQLDKLADPARMRGLGFCVSVEHARFMAERFRASGFAAEALDASTPADVRQAAQLQPLGRGLRLSPETGKSCLTVLDFIGQQHRRFRFGLRYRALLGCKRAGAHTHQRPGRGAQGPGHGPGRLLRHPRRLLHRPAPRAAPSPPPRRPAAQARWAAPADRCRWPGR